MYKVKFKLNKFFSLIRFKFAYGKRFKHGKINFRRNFFVMIEKKGSVEIGNNCFFNNDCSINSLNSVKIGNDCIFGENVKIYDHNHKFNGEKLIKDQGFSTKPVIIGSNVWIGSNCTILAGTEIGDNCVISAGIVLSGKVNPGTIIKRNSENYNVESIRKEIE